jgi:hypothetical protein
MVKKKAPKKELTPAQLAARRQKARERHWRKTNVSEGTIRWMKENGML